MDWHKDTRGEIITDRLILYKSYLERLDHLDSHTDWLLTESKKDNITSCKVYFNTFIFIHIKDFKAGKYKLWNNKRSFKK